MQTGIQTNLVNDRNYGEARLKSKKEVSNCLSLHSLFAIEEKILLMEMSRVH